MPPPMLGHVIPIRAPVGGATARAPLRRLAALSISCSKDAMRAGSLAATTASTSAARLPSSMTFTTPCCPPAGPAQHDQKKQEGIVTAGRPSMLPLPKGAHTPSGHPSRNKAVGWRTEGGGANGSTRHLCLQTRPGDRKCSTALRPGVPCRCFCRPDSALAAAHL